MTCPLSPATPHPDDGILSNVEAIHRLAGPSLRAVLMDLCQPLPAFDGFAPPPDWRFTQAREERT